VRSVKFVTDLEWCDPSLLHAGLTQPNGILEGATVHSHPLSSGPTPTLTNCGSRITRRRERQRQPRRRHRTWLVMLSSSVDRLRPPRPRPRSGGPCCRPSQRRRPERSSRPQHLSRADADFPDTVANVMRFGLQPFRGIRVGSLPLVCLPCERVVPR
jgi:hypothetical protein